MTVTFEDHAESLLLPQFRDSTNIIATLRGLVSPLEEMRDVTYDIGGAYDVNTAVGVQLDKVGKLLNVSRLERSDDDYRAAIKGRILVNNSKGTSRDFIRLLKLALGNIQFTVIEDPSAPAQVQVVIYSPQNVIDEQLVNDITPVGVRGVFFGNPYEGKTIFQLGDVSNDGLSISGGTPMVNVADLPTTEVVLINIIYA